MPYETGSTSGVADLISRIESFATTNGWTKTGDVVHKGNVFFELEAFVPATKFDSLRMSGGTGQLGGSLTGAGPEQVQMLVNSSTDFNVTWPATYHLFVHTAPDFLFCVLNFNTELIQWLMAGELSKYGTWGGGQYYGATHSIHSGNFDSNYMQTRVHSSTFQGTNPTSMSCGPWFLTASSDSYPSSSIYMVCDIDGSSGDWAGNRAGRGGTFEMPLDLPEKCFAASMLHYDKGFAGRNTFNSQPIVDPMKVGFVRTDDKISVIGTPEHIRYTDIRNIGMAEVLTIGSDKWMAFPLFKKSNGQITGVTQNSDILNSESGNLGFAVRYDGP